MHVASLEISGLVKGYGNKPVLTGVDLQVNAGTITAILGPSGSGKTTLLRVICGFERAQAGSIAIDGEVVDDSRRFVPPERRRIGYVPQEGNLFPHLTVAGNIRFGLRRNEESRRRVGELLNMIGLADRARSYPHQLSGGQQQRVALARALAIRPRLVLLDEPFASLDATLRASVRHEVSRILREAEATALLVTHDQDEALSMSDHVAVIREGAIAQLDTPRGLYANPVDADLARFVGEVNLIPGSFSGEQVTTDLGTLQLHPSTQHPSDAREATVLVRPEQILVTAADRTDDAVCEVVDHEFYGHDAIVRVRIARDPKGRVVVVRVRGGVDWTPGSLVHLQVDGPVLAWAATESQSAAAQSTDSQSARAQSAASQSAASQSSGRESSAQP
jgi:iron(III) transport system ATP-binding protein